MRLLSAILASTQGRIVLGAVVGLSRLADLSSLSAPQKIAPGFTAERPRANILVTLPFPPERFHVLYFQRYGRVSGTQDNSIEVRNVRQADLTAVARPYWVRRVEPLPTGG